MTEATFELRDLDIIGVTARGSRLAPKPVSRIRVMKMANTESGADASGGNGGEDENGDSEKTQKPKAKKGKKKPPGEGGEQFSLF